MATPPPPRSLGRYEVIGALAHGGMGSVYLARHSGEAGFQRLYAIKILHAHLAEDVTFVEMMLDEARIAARLHHPNVVPIVDLGTQNGLHYVVMEYVEGCALSALLTRHRDHRPPRMLVPIVLDALAGLHAAHTLVDDDGTPLGLVHRDVSAHNVLVGVDGSSRITDFGVAKAAARIHTTRPGHLKGKLAFMSPEHIKGSAIDRRSDIFSAGAMLWCALTGRKLFLGASDAETLHNVLMKEVLPPSSVGFCPPKELDAVCLRALEREPDKRFATALEMEEALREAAEAAGVLGSKREIAAFVSTSFEEELGSRRSAIRAAVTPSSGVLSSIRTLPVVATITPTASTTPTVSAPDAPMPAPAPRAASPRWIKPWLAASALLGGVGVAAMAISLARGRVDAPPAHASPATTPSEPPVASTPVAPPPSATTSEPPPLRDVPAVKPAPSSKPAVGRPPAAYARPARAAPTSQPASTKPGVPIVTDEF